MSWLPSRVDFGLFYFMHGFDVALELGGEALHWRARYLPRSDVRWRRWEFRRQGGGHGDFATPAWYVVCLMYRKEVYVGGLHGMSEKRNVQKRM